ncbi:hypothetical protein B0J14DRAFT_588773 [Halenospora varia]|nr:hypothetical protein B0J14DRAFT_588773 [Halenospora varia]
MVPPPSVTPSPPRSATVHSRAPAALDSVFGPPLASPVVSKEVVDVFPIYKDGDVTIYCNWKDYTWKLHSTILIKTSPFFKELLASVPEAKKKHEGTRYKIRLVVYEKDPSDMRFRSFLMINQNEKNNALHEALNTNEFLGGYNDNNPPPFLQVYNNFFRIICGIEPKFTKDEKAEIFISEAVTLLLAGEQVSSVPAIRQVVETHFLRLGQTLWHHVCGRSEFWSYLAARLQSPIIFKDAMCHLIGRINTQDAINRQFMSQNELRRQILDLADKKAKELKQEKLKVQRNLIEHWPARMFHMQDGYQIPNRAVYGSDIYLYQARALVQQYISSAYLNNLHHCAPDGGARFYRTIGKAGDAYLAPKSETIENFFMNFSMSGKGKVCFLDALAVVKNEIAPLVEGLLKDCTHAKRNEGEEKLNWLTCVEISDEELPWTMD